LSSTIRISPTTVPRRCPLRLPEAWQPPVPAWCSELSAVPEAVVSYLGVQSRATKPPDEVRALRARVEPSAARVEQAWFADPEGYRNDVLVAYWRDPHAYETWTNGAFSIFWSARERLTGDVGFWRETFRAPADHRETLFSGDDRPAGLAALGARFVGPVAEHGYWGGARDRIPCSGRSELSADARLAPRRGDTLGRRVVIEPPEHLCVIRSAQDSTDCSGREAELFDSSVFPVLVDGMRYLSEHPAETGCYSCRFMQESSPGAPARPRTFAVGQFVSLEHLERWAASHPTHLRIFDRFLTMATELGPAIRLRLWHEVFVLPRAAGRFEYVNCHPGTGLLPFLEAVDSG
jgi:aldoxime dehydratase